ncbi:hypothetical protein EV1_018892 [Malus domestica]
MKSEVFFEEFDVGLVESEGFDVGLSFFNWTFLVELELELEWVVDFKILVWFLEEDRLGLRSLVWFFEEDKVGLINLVLFFEEDKVGLINLVWFFEDLVVVVVVVVVVEDLVFLGRSWSGSISNSNKIFLVLATKCELSTDSEWAERRRVGKRKTRAEESRSTFLKLKYMSGAISQPMRGFPFPFTDLVPPQSLDWIYN